MSGKVGARGTGGAAEWSASVASEAALGTPLSVRTGPVESDTSGPVQGVPAKPDRLANRHHAATRRDAFEADENASLAADAARLFRGKLAASLMVVPASGKALLDAKADAIRFSQRVAPKSGVEGSRAARGGEAGRTAAKGRGLRLMHVGALLQPNEATIALGRGRSIAHRPAGLGHSAVITR